MLQAYEVDADFFTPAPNTSLASIFNTSQPVRNDASESLIYVPETPVKHGGSHNNIDEMQKSPIANATSKCVFATSVSAYEWVESKYKLLKKLGFAIIHDSKDNNHHLIIYSSEKHTLSCATIASNLLVKVKKLDNISYYDNYKKYWLISASANEINEIVKCLETLKVNIEFVDSAKTTPDDVKEKSNTTELSFENVDSDTDPRISKKNKHSILQRVASMGQSVLPANKNIESKSTDSSDNNDFERLPALRHKITKPVSKRSTIDKNALSAIKQNNEIGKMLPDTSERKEYSALSVKQEVTSNMNLEPNNYNNNMNVLITEQRINNSELRINMNRISDKVEQICKKMYCGQVSNQNDIIINKLLKEYERKILLYEKFMKLKGLECNLIYINDNEGDSSDIENKSTESNIKQCYIQDLDMNELNRKIDILTDGFSQTLDQHRQHEDILKKEIHDLKQDLIQKNMVLKSIDKNIHELTASSVTEDYSNKLKNIMNSTYHAISNQFNDEDDYTGITVKNIVAKVIKKTTMECLQHNE